MSLFDKNMSKEKRDSLEFAEDSRESEWNYPSLVLNLFHGRIRWDLLCPFPRQTPQEKRAGDAYLAELEAVLKECLDPDEVDRTGEIPQKLYDELARIKAFAMKIPAEYGGAGLSQMNYNRAIHLVASYCGSTAVLLSAHQSIGVPQPLKLFGTEEQKKKYLPKFAEGVISAFALTEPEAGSDPRNMTTTATPVGDGQYFLINGEKLWTTNGPIAGVIVVMAVTPPRIVNGREKKQITAFIVETDTPGFEVAYRCSFMGLNGIQNGLLRFKDVKVPRENIILGEGEGLRLALMTLNTGRLTLPAASTGIAKWCLNLLRKWCRTRKQWGAPIGEHEAVALKCARITATTFAMEAMTRLSSFMADDKDKDIRLEAAMAKYFCTQQCWNIVDETLQIRGGQGYERAESLRARGQPGWPVERVLRDCRINTIIEGTTEIMHLFIAREALDPHLKRAKPILDSHASRGEKVRALISSAGFYLKWYSGLWVPVFDRQFVPEFPIPLQAHVDYLKQTSRRLARHIFHQMLIHGPKLEARQGVLGRVVDIGTELFAMAAACSYARALSQSGTQSAKDLADLFCRQARVRIEALFRANLRNSDRLGVSVARNLLNGEYAWMETDIITDHG